ncbi:MAG: GNAT family N-acetyltransferase [Chloroflexota bacterium]|nr:GNAT family N-acetyltransferase [Anaerolineae bacterium]
MFECPFELVPASSFSADELAEIYNAGRVDYIVPMPMNAKRIQNYVRTYDIDLDASVIILDSDNQPAGLGMLGVRDDRGWITRLGIIPAKRRAGMGMCMMQALIAAARTRYVRLIQLEVIEGNDPAHRLFLRCGFRETRRLMVIRRPPEPPPPEEPPIAGMTVSQLTQDEIWACLAQRGPGASWVNENASLVKVEKLDGLRVKLPSGYSGWVIFQCKRFEMTHVVLQIPAPVREQMMIGLLYHLHRLHTQQDTKIENIPVTEMAQPVLQQFNYVEEFRRIEMFLHL